MPRRLSARSGFMLLLVVALATGARAQLLDFGSGAPKAGSGRSALSLAASLSEQADDIAGGREEGAIWSVDAARIAMRRLAAAMLTQGEHAGPAGSGRIVAARRIAERLDRLDSLIAERAGNDASVPETVHAQAALALRAIPENDAQLDRLVRNVFAVLIPSNASPIAEVGWSPDNVAKQPGFDAEIGQWETKISESALDAMRSLDKRLTALERWPAYHGSVASLREQVRGRGAVSFA